MTNRVYVQTAVFGARITGMRNLWDPSNEFRGQRTPKPNYLASVIIPKTQAHWSREPILNVFTQACMELHSKALSHMSIEQIGWPVKDGDQSPEPGRAPADWARGHWMLAGSSSSPINVEMVQGGQPIKLVNRSGVKPGDVVTIAGALAVKMNDPRGVKFYCNNVLFMAAGEEIAVGNSETGASLMEKAKAQGMAITGFQYSGGGGQFGGAAAGGGFSVPAGGFGGVAPGAAGGGFGNGSGGGGFTQPAPAQPGGTATFSTGNSGFAPAPAQPPGQGGGFGPVPGFAPPR